MRLSTAQIYDTGINGMLRIQYDQFRIQNQISTGRRVVTPADDPVAAAQALITQQKQSVNSQFMDNQASAKTQLAEIETQMQGMGDILNYLKSRWVDAGNGIYGDDELKAIAIDVRGRFEQMLGIANGSDATGLFRFAGFQGATQPFVNNGGVVTYQGDAGSRQLQVESNRFMDVSFSGKVLFEGVPGGNGSFMVNADSANTGSGVISNGSVVGSFDGQNYTLVFDSPNSYTVNGGPSTPFTAGDAINLGGASFTITGAPATGDQFTIAPSQNESIFTVLNNFISALEAGNSGTPADKAQFQNAMSRVGASLDQGLQHVLNNRAVVGAQLSELDALTSMGQDMDVQFQSQISDLVDLDYASAISELSKKTLQLQAAQQSFMKITGLSLFNLI